VKKSRCGLSRGTNIGSVGWKKCQLKSWNQRISTASSDVCDAILMVFVLADHAKASPMLKLFFVRQIVERPFCADAN